MRYETLQGGSLHLDNLQAWVILFKGIVCSAHPNQSTSGVMRNSSVLRDTRSLISFSSLASQYLPHPCITCARITPGFWLVQIQTIALVWFGFFFALVFDTVLHCDMFTHTIGSSGDSDNPHSNQCPGSGYVRCFELPTCEVFLWTVTTADGVATLSGTHSWLLFIDILSHLGLFDNQTLLAIRSGAYGKLVHLGSVFQRYSCWLFHPRCAVCSLVGCLLLGRMFNRFILAKGVKCLSNHEASIQP